MKASQANETSKPGSKYVPDIFDKWIDSRLNSAIMQYKKSLESYKINEASSALYDFIWRDYCDWYIEILKIKTNEKPESAKIIVDNAISIFLKAMQLMHPVMPFISEELWQSMKDRKTEESITVSDFPAIDESQISEELENEVLEFQQLITAIRNLRSEVTLSPSVKCDVVIVCPNETEKHFIDEAEGYIRSLAKIGDLKSMLPEQFAAMEKFKSITSVVGQLQVYMKIEGLIDIDQEKARLNKEIERAESFLSSINKKLTNEKFMSKASEEVINNEKKKLSDTETKLEKLKSHLKSLV
jgi:valyl-tRNA synthetase